MIRLWLLWDAFLFRLTHVYDRVCQPECWCQRAAQWGQVD